MTELLYLQDSYIKSFEAKVTVVDSENKALALDRTAFYPGGGGQPADAGSLKIDGETYPIRRAKKSAGQIFHYIDGDSPLPAAGAIALGEIDWERRYKLMRTHTAMHVLCGVIFRDYGASVTGGNMEPLHGRMDFEFETMRKELVEVIEDRINQEAQKGYAIQTRILPREEAFQIPDLIRTKINLLPEGIKEVRVVEIVGLDLQADGGTHVRNTSEVGRMKIVDYKSKGKINKRIYLELED